VNYFQTNKNSYSGGYLYGSVPGRSFDTYPTVLQQPTNFRELSGVPGFTELVTKAGKITNPSRPYISLPVIIGELRDVPRMIRHAGRFLNGTAWKHTSGLSAAKELASENLAIQFGWAPIVSDLAKAIRFTEAYDRRVNELNRLYSGRGLGRRVKLGSWSTTGSVVIPAYTAAGLNFTIPCQQKSTMEAWATIRWSPTTALTKPKSPDDVKNLMKGLTLHNVITTAWELLPWSWLIDYFSNVGDFLSLTNNSLLAEVKQGALMRHYVYARTWGKYVATQSGQKVYLEGGHSKRERKYRHPFGASDFGITASFQILSGKQLSILGSLALLRS
jgi:hypothetical protein